MCLGAQSLCPSNLHVGPLHRPSHLPCGEDSSLNFTDEETSSQEFRPLPGQPAPALPTVSAGPGDGFRGAEGGTWGRRQRGKSAVNEPRQTVGSSPGFLA